MRIRPAKPADIPALLRLLSQVLEVHAKLRPDLFRAGTVKYGEAELEDMLRDPAAPVFVAETVPGNVAGYAFCREKEPPFGSTMRPGKTLFIDDLCVDEACRRQGVGEALFAFVKEEARRRGCRDLTLNVWAGNGAAERFYGKMGMRPRETMLELPLQPGNS